MLSVNNFGITKMFEKSTPYLHTVQAKANQESNKLARDQWLEDNRVWIEALQEAKKLVKGYFEKDGKVDDAAVMEFLEEVVRIKLIDKKAVNWEVLEKNESLTKRSHSVIPSRA